ncbi:MAG TPA: hypothetical protein VHG91_16160 [Longimicrobium sp.]|nr:hypothetical protein [Longimicrobium sp.]
MAKIESARLHLAVGALFTRKLDVVHAGEYLARRGVGTGRAGAKKNPGFITAASAGEE